MGIQVEFLSLGWIGIERQGAAKQSETPANSSRDRPMSAALGPLARTAPELAYVVT